MSYCSGINKLTITCNISRMMEAEGGLDKMKASGLVAYGRMLYGS